MDAGAARRGRRVSDVPAPNMSVPGAADTVGAFAELAVKCGVRHLVLLSGRGKEEALLAERAVQNSGADWTILRSTGSVRISTKGSSWTRS